MESEIHQHIHEVSTSLPSVVVEKFAPIFRQKDWRTLISSRIYLVTRGKCWDNDIIYTTGCFFNILTNILGLYFIIRPRTTVFSH